MASRQLLQRPPIQCSRGITRCSGKTQMRHMWFKVAGVLFSYPYKVPYDTWLPFTSQPYFLTFLLHFAHFAPAKLAFSVFIQLQVISCHGAFAHAARACRFPWTPFPGVSLANSYNVSVLRLNITLLEKPFSQSSLGCLTFYCYNY